MRKIKCAVIGVGYLGKFHAEKFATAKTAELVVVCDTNEGRAQEVGNNLRARAVQDYRSLVDQVEAVSIAVPTVMHYTVAKFFLEHKKHVLLEKPIATTVVEADELVALARRHDLIFQIGHLERFNPVLIEAHSVLDQPRYIESHRIATFKPRGTDVNVMLDLMIHDIDIIQYLIDSPIREIRANGAAILSQDTDIATARILFENACVANVVASRVSLKAERKMRIFQHNAYIFLDLQDKLISVYSKGTSEMFPGIPEIIKQELTIDPGDALRDEINAFLQSVLNHTPPVVTGEDGRRALATAIEINRHVNEQFDFAAAPAAPS